MKKNSLFIFFALLTCSHLLFAQTKSITLEDIWQKNTFASKSIPGFNFMNDGKHYSLLQENKIKKFDLTTGKEVGIIYEPNSNSKLDIESYTFSKDEGKILIQSNSKPLYRHSFTAEYFIWDGKTSQLSTLLDGEQVMNAGFSPDANKVAFVKNNDLYVKDLPSGKITRVTSDGKQNAIINGAPDWVYEEEFSFSVAYQWSPDSKKVAFMRFDESEVPQFSFQTFTGSLYPNDVTYKYPKVGEKNAIVQVFIYNSDSNTSVKADTGSETDIYFPRIKWTQNPNQLCITRLNRHQNHLELLLADAATGKTNLLFEEKNKYYVDIHDNLTFLKDGKHFLWTSEADGYNHLYLYDMQGKLKQQITKGNWELSDFYGINEKTQTLYFQSTEASPTQRQVYSIDLKGKNKKALTQEKGWHTAQFSSTFDYFVSTYSNANTPSSYAVFDKNAKLVRNIEDNAKLKATMQTYSMQPVEFFNFQTSEKVSLNGWMIKPANFDSSKKYPVFMFEYGGPGSQQVMDNFGGRNYWWFQMLAQKGYIVACVDNRGTGGRGEEFKKMTYLQLGKYETIDQIEAAKYLATQPFVDGSRIGIFGWSYGGYLSSLCLLKGNDTFKAAIAVAPVTSWKWYDSIYTERFMRSEKENPAGYRDNSPVYFADRLKGNYLLIHGVADDNVHFQNAVEMANALIDNNKQFDTYFYPNRNHGIYGGNTRLHLYTKMTDFILNKL